MQLPLVCQTDIVVQELAEELMIYNIKIDRAFCLNKTSAIVFNACGRRETFAAVKKEHALTDDLIYLALDELKKNNLLEAAYTSPFAGMSRREVIRRVGLASMIALPVISSLVAPPAANAGSNCGGTCQSIGCPGVTCIADGCPVGYGPTEACFIGAPECCSGVAIGTSNGDACVNHICDGGGEG